jgi:hypothetical protein
VSELLLTDLGHGEHLDRDRAAQVASQLTAAVVTSPSEFLIVRNESLSKAEQDSRSERVSKLLEYETAELRDRAIGAVSGRGRAVSVDRINYVKRFFATAESGDEDMLLEYGLDASCAWLDDIAKAMISGWPVEIEAFAPSWSAFQPPRSVDRLDFEHLHPSHVTGADIAAMLRRVTEPTPNVKIVTFAHDYDRYSPQVHPDVAYPQNHFVASLGKFLIDKNALLATDTPGRDFLMLRESDQIPKVGELMERLAGYNEGKIINGGQRFRPALSYEDVIGPSIAGERIISEGIQLGYVDGSPSLPALEAASFINPTDAHMNERFVHLIIQPSGHDNEQLGAQTLTLAAGLTSRELYHRITYGTSGLTNDMITYTTGKLLQRYIDEYRKSLHRYSEWGDANPRKYARLHYGKIADEDRQLIPAAIDLFEELGLEAGQFEVGMDVGTGSNWYQVMLGKPYVRGRMTAREFSPSYRTFLEDLVGGRVEPEFVNMWKPFEELMAQKNPELYENCLEKSLAETDIESGSIYDLPEGQIDYLSAFFVLESIVDSKLPFWQLFRIVGRALRPKDPDNPKDRGGIFTGAFMVGSEGWEFGDGTFFPAVNVNFDQIKQACNDASLECMMVMIGDDGKVTKVREGYAGMAFMVAWKKEKVPYGGRGG